jgi:hypothetical protein
MCLLYRLGNNSIHINKTNSYMSSQITKHTMNSLPLYIGCVFLEAIHRTLSFWLNAWEIWGTGNSKKYYKMHSKKTQPMYSGREFVVCFVIWDDIYCSFYWYGWNCCRSLLTTFVCPWHLHRFVLFVHYIYVYSIQQMYINLKSNECR